MGASTPRWRCSAGSGSSAGSPAAAVAPDDDDAPPPRDLTDGMRLLRIPGRLGGQTGVQAKATAAASTTMVNANHEKNQ